MSSKACLALLLDGPMQSWGHTSRFERRTTALHPTRSGVIGLIAAAMGIDKFSGDEKLARFDELSIVTATIPRRSLHSGSRLVQRMLDYHTVTGIRRASGKMDSGATVQTYRHYLLDARFGVLLDGSAILLQQIEAALINPRWGVWLGRKCCIPASPVLAAPVSNRSDGWRHLLRRCGYEGDETLDMFDHVVEVGPNEAGADVIDDQPLGYGRPIGERHAPRWIRRVPKTESSPG